MALQASAVAGSNQTYGDEVTQSGVWNKLSYSLGQFHYETDGFRENNDLTEDIYNVFVQTNLSPSLSLQAEARRRELDHGDLRFNFDLDQSSEGFKRNLDTDSARLGARYVPTPHLDVIASATYLSNDSDQDFGTVSLRDEVHGYLFEAQSLSRGHRFNVLVGGSYYQITTDLEFGRSDGLSEPPSRIFVMAMLTCTRTLTFQAKSHGR